MSYLNINSQLAKTPTKSDRTGGLLSSTEFVDRTPSFIESNLYLNDADGSKMFADLAANNPLQDSIKEVYSSVNSGLEELDHAYPYINKYKTIDIAVTSMVSGKPTHQNGCWGNWRKLNYCNIPVDNRVLLFSDSMEFSFSYSNKYDNAWEGLSSKGVLSKISQMSEMLRSVGSLAGASSGAVAGKMVSKYTQTPSWTSSSSLKAISDIKFNFKWGQSGIFSGEHEVVRPILALASLFAPLGGTYRNGPAPTPPYFLAKFLTGLGNNIMSEIVGIVEEVKKSAASANESQGGGAGGVIAGGLSGALTGVTALEESLMRQQDAAIEAALAEKSRALMLRVGRMIIGPLVVKDVSWTFDFNQVDEYGFPYQGTLSFSGLEGIVLVGPQEFKGLFDAPQSDDSFKRQSTGEVDENGQAYSF